MSLQGLENKSDFSLSVWKLNLMSLQGKDLKMNHILDFELFENFDLMNFWISQKLWSNELAWKINLMSFYLMRRIVWNSNLMSFWLFEKFLLISSLIIWKVVLSWSRTLEVVQRWSWSGLKQVLLTALALNNKISNLLLIRKMGTFKSMLAPRRHHIKTAINWIWFFGFYFFEIRDIHWRLYLKLMIIFYMYFSNTFQKQKYSCKNR